MRAQWICLTVLLAGTAAFADTKGKNQDVKLTGLFHLGGKTAVDPPTDEPRDTHAYFRMTGEAARILYQAMKVAPIYDECLDDGSTAKWSDNMRCTLSEDKHTYACSFIIDIKNQKIESNPC